MIDGFPSEFICEAETYATSELGYKEGSSYPVSIEAKGLRVELPMTQTQLFYMLKAAYLAGRMRFTVKGKEDRSIQEFTK